MTEDHHAAGDAAPGLRDRTILITGATGGLGRATAAALATRGATVILVGRDQAKGVAVQRQLATADARVDVLAADLSSQAEVRRVAAEVVDRYPRLDVLVNNAGVTNPARRLTVDGMEETFAVNHLAPYLLTNLLLPVLRAARQARVVTVSSSAYRMGRIDFDDLQSARRYGQHRAYNQSKLATILFTRELARRQASAPAAAGAPAGTVSATAVEPGFVRTGMVPPFPFNLVGFLRTAPERAARAVVTLAAAADLTTDNGVVFSHTGSPLRLTGRADDAELARRLWDVSAELTGA